MDLIAGTVDGIWRIGGEHETRRLLGAGAGPLTVWRVKRAGGDLYAATEVGLFRSKDGGLNWSNLSVPVSPVYSVAISPDDRVYAGTHPPRVFVSTKSGWTECETLQNQPSRSDWDSPVHDEGQVRHLAVPPEAPETVIAGIERGGVHVSDDRGETWTERREGVWDDIHHLHRVGQSTYYAATGSGLYRTDDTGRSWTRLDEARDRSYFRECHVHDGIVYAGVTMGPSTTWRGATGADAVLLESSDRGQTFQAVQFPGNGTEAVLAWANNGDQVFAGTDRGRVLVRKVGGWEEWAQIPAGIRSLAVAP